MFLISPKKIAQIRPSVCLWDVAKNYDMPTFLLVLDPKR